MATKKSAIVLKDEKINDMVAAGIEVKLTKMEIADYIAAKAEEQLNARLSHLKETYDKFVSTKFIEPTHEQKIVIDGLNKLSDTKYSLSLVYSSSYLNPNDNQWRVQIVCEGHMYSGTLVYMLADKSQIPNINLAEIVLEIRDIEKRIYELKNKKHRTILVEQILSGSDSGKKVLADLTNMVQRVVSGK